MSEPSIVGNLGLDGIRILVVDGDVAKRDLLLLELQKYTFDTGSGDLGTSGYQAVLEHVPDIIISDVIDSGDPGWWLFNRFGRHPLLRWVPILFFSWWNEAFSSSEQEATDQLLKRVSEILTPLRELRLALIQEKMIQGHMDFVGSPVFLKLVEEAQSTGRMTLKGPYSAFDLAFQDGRPIAVVRRGNSGDVDDGEKALHQFMFCDVGEWKFKAQDQYLGKQNMDHASNIPVVRGLKRLVKLIGPKAGTGVFSEKNIEIHKRRLRAAITTLSGFERTLVEGIASGMSTDEVSALIVGEADIVLSERAMVTLVRMGAIVPHDDRRPKERGRAEELAASAISVVLERISQDHRVPSEGKSQKEKKFSGRAGRVLLTPEPTGLMIPVFEGNEPAVVTDLDPSTQLYSPMADEPESVWSNTLQLFSFKHIKFKVKLPFLRSVYSVMNWFMGRNTQMWLAVLLFVIIVILFVAGLVAIGSSSRGLSS